MSRQKGFHHSEETKQKQRLRAVGRLHTPETKQKIKIGRAKQVITPKMLEGLKMGRGEGSYLYKDGRMSDPKYVSWLKNQYCIRKRNAEGYHTYGEWELLKKQYGYRCANPECKKIEPEIKLTQDHIIPLSKGGTNYIENIQPLCGYCNSKKNATTIKY